MMLSEIQWPSVRNSLSESYKPRFFSQYFSKLLLETHEDKLMHSGNRSTIYKFIFKKAVQWCMTIPDGLMAGLEAAGFDTAGLEAASLEAAGLEVVRLVAF